MALTIPVFKQPVAISSLTGRVFYGAGSFLYYSQVAVVNRSVGFCYQINDPTSDDNPDLLATDGGRIELDEAVNIFKVFPFRGGVLVFAENGTWYVYGDNGFSADNYNIVKITERVLNSPTSVVQAEDIVFFMTNSGIQQVTTTELNYPVSQDITEKSIRSWYLDNLEGKNCTGEYREREKEIWWCSTIDGTILVHDLKIPAFFPQENAKCTAAEITAGTQTQIQRGLSTGQDFVFPNYSYSAGTLTYGFGTDTSTDFKDFTADQDAYLVTAEETLGKFSHKKAITYADLYFNKTETTVTGFDEGTMLYTYDNPSSCLFQARWDFDGSNAFNKWVGKTTTDTGAGKKMQLYNPMRRGFIPDSFPWTFDTGETVIHKKIKVRGNGKAVQFKFEAQPEKDLQLLGYSVDFSMNGRR